MKKILASVMTIFATGAMAAGATGAWLQNGGGHGGYDFNSGKIDLKIDHSLSIYNGLECIDGVWREETGHALLQAVALANAGDPCKEWEAKDLKRKDNFYLFGDVKPGDSGRDIISLHVNAKETLNACLFAFHKDKENGRNEPERGVDASAGKGELSQYLKLFAWDDANQDGMFNPSAGETELYRGLMRDEAILLTLTKEKPVFVGTAWCAGEQSIDMATGEISCDGSGMGDIAQTDQMRLALIGYAEAKRWYSPLFCKNVSHEYHRRNVNDDEHDY